MKFVVCESTFIESRNKQTLFGESEQLAEILAAACNCKSMKQRRSLISDSNGQTMRTIGFCGSINMSRDFITDDSAW